MSTSSAAAQSISSSADSEVTLADQKLINRFARLNAKCEELATDLSTKLRQLENTSDATTELVLLDGDSVLVRTGEVFAQMSAEAAEQWCEGLKSGLEANVAAIKSAVETMRSEMTTIKATLYAKFGSNINLEYDDEEDNPM